MNTELHLHDFEISSISVDEKQHEFKLIAISDVRSVEIKFSAVRFIRIMDFLMQNVISRIYFLDPTIHSRDFVEDRVRFANSDSAGFVLMKEEHIAKNVDDVMYGICKIAIFEPSCGAEVIVSFSEFHLRDIT